MSLLDVSLISLSLQSKFSIASVLALASVAETYTLCLYIYMYYSNVHVHVSIYYVAYRADVNRALWQIYTHHSQCMRKLALHDKNLTIIICV